MDEALEAAEFLARSENRVAALFELRDRAQTRAELREKTGMSQVTIGRVLEALEDRRWIEADGEAYRTTAVGDMVAESLDGFLDALAAAETLGDIARWLPTEEYDFGLDRLADADVIRPGPTDPNVTLRTAAEQVAESDHVQILTHAFSTMVTDVIHERVTAGEMTAECVFSPAVYEALERAGGVNDEFLALIDADGATFYRYDGEVPHVLAVLDDGVGIGVDDEEGLPRAVLDVSDPVVREWAVETFERYRADAVLVEDYDDLAPVDHDE